MYEDFMKMAQDSMKPMLKMVENNTAMAVKLMQAQAETTSELMQSNLVHVQALVETKDLSTCGPRRWAGINEVRGHVFCSLAVRT